MERTIRMPEFVGPEFKGHWRDDLTDIQYHQERAVSSTGAKAMLISPRAFYRSFCLGRAKPSSPTMNFGKAVHMALLEPRRFKDTYVLQPDFGDMRSSTNRTKRDAWRAGLPKGTEVLEADELEKLNCMVDSFMGHAFARQMFSSELVFEASGFFRDPVTGLKCRVRPDALHTGLAVMPDIKTCRDPGKREFTRTIFNRGYAFQMAFYQLGIEQILGRKPEYTPIIAIQNEEPFDIAVYVPDPVMLDQGAREVRYCLDKIAHSTKENHWPGIQGDGRPEDVTFEPWMMKDEEVAA